MRPDLKSEDPEVETLKGVSSLKIPAGAQEVSPTTNISV